MLYACVLCYMYVRYVTCTCVMLHAHVLCYVMLHARELCYVTCTYVMLCYMHVCYVLLHARVFYREVFFESKSVTSIWALGSSRVYVKLTYI